MSRALIAAVLAGLLLLSGCVHQSGDNNTLERLHHATAPATIPVQGTMTFSQPGKPAEGPEEFKPGGTFSVGDEILIAGTTILSPGNRLLIEIRSVAFGPSNKTDTAYFSGSSAVIEVLKGSRGGQNTWRYVLNTSGFVPGDYSLEITGLDVQGFRESGTFTLIP